MIKELDLQAKQIKEEEQTCKLCKKMMLLSNSQLKSEIQIPKIASNICDESIIETFSQMRQIQEENKNFRYKEHDLFENIIHLRGQMIDWLVIVCSELNQNNSTFFLTIDILDKMIEFYKFKLSQDDLHLITMVCLFIASKIEEIKPVRLSSLITDVGHDKYKKKDILSAEIVILSNLKYKIPKNAFNDFINIMLLATFSKSSSRGHSCKYQQIVFSHASANYKIVLLDYFYNKRTNIFLNYSSILYQSLLAINEQINYRSRSVAKFSKIVENFNVISCDFLKNMLILKKLKENFYENKDQYTFISKIECQRFSLVN